MDDCSYPPKYAKFNNFIIQQEMWTEISFNEWYQQNVDKPDSRFYRQTKWKFIESMKLSEHVHIIYP